MKCHRVVLTGSYRRASAHNYRLLGLLASWLIFILGCPKADEGVSGALAAANKRHVIAIYQIGLNIREGLPSSAEMTSARVLKRVDQPEQVDSFVRIISKATPGRSFANHPISIGNCVLRIVIDGQPHLLYCEMLESKDGKYCVFSLGGANEVDINRMPQFESKPLAEWLRENGITVK